MILILSQSSMEPTTEEVMDWLEALGTRCVRLNGEDLDGGAALRFHLGGGRVELRIEDDGVALPLAEVGAVWFRRWLFEARCEVVSILAENHDKLCYDLRRHLRSESRKLSDFLFSRFAALPWLSQPRRSGLTKLDVLTRAAGAGLDTPATLVTTERDELRRFCAAHGRVITKPIAEVDMFLDGERSYFPFTTVLDLPAVEALPERFAPSLFQEQVEKEYELRVFYLAGECLVVDLETFAEGQKHNTCLNRKISVDARGEIRNCPSLPRSFGNVREVSLHSALAHRDFAALWQTPNTIAETVNPTDFIRDGDHE